MNPTAALGVDVGCLGCRFAVAAGEGPLPLSVPSELTGLPTGAPGDWRTRLGREGDLRIRHLLRHTLAGGLEAARADGGARIERMVLAVPARFTPDQREALCRIALEAGGEEVCLISASVAQAAAHAERTDSGHFLVFQCGYSGLELAVISVLGDSIQVLGYGGDQHLSGCHIQRKILQRLITRAFVSPETAARALRSDVLPDSFFARLRDELTRGKDAEAVFVLPGGERFPAAMARSDHDQVVRQAFEEALPEVNALLMRARMRPTGLTEVLLGGGPTADPACADVLEKHLQKPVKRMPAWSVAFGAAIAAAKWRRLARAPGAGIVLYEQSDLPEQDLKAGGAPADDGARQPILFALSAGEETPDRSPVHDPPRGVPSHSAHPGNTGPYSANLSRRIAMRSIERSRELLAANRLADAVNLSHRAYNDAPNCPDVFSAMIDIHCCAALACDTPERYALSLEWLYCALAFDQGNAQTRRAIADRHFLHARQAAARGQRDEARRAAELAQRMNPDSPEIQQLLRELRPETG